MQFEEFKLYAKRRLSQEFLPDDVPLTGKYDFPQLAPVNYLPEEPVLPFNYLKSSVKKGRYWYHCFTADKNFNRLYTHFQEYAEILLRGAKGLISADFSLYRDYPEEMLINTCRDNRAVDYALQQAGLPVIPTAGFAGESSWEWCFDGLPLNSTVAVTTNCLGRDRETHRLFVGGINAMVKKIHPTAIVVCGKVPDWLPKRHPDIQIVHIPSYSEMWHEREKRKLSGKRILKGGYGGESGRARRLRDGYYKKTNGDRVKDNNAIEVAEYYISWGFYVEFLPERPPKKAPDLFVDFEFLAEVKSISSTKANKFANRINEAFDQIADELARYPDDEPKPPGKVIFLSRHDSFEIGFHAFCEGYKEAKRKGFIRGEVEFWFHGEIHTFEEEKK